MIRKIALIGAATLFSVSLATAQSSAPSSTAGGATGTSKSGQMEQPAPGANRPGVQSGARQGTTTGSGSDMRGHSSPDATSGGAAGTTKGGRETPGAR